MKRSISQGNLDEEEEFNQVFGDILELLSKNCKDSLTRIRRNSDNRDSFFSCRFCLGEDDAQQFTNAAWELLGRYIANNSLLKKITLDEYFITDEKITFFFKGLGKSSSLDELKMNFSRFGVVGMQSMVPLLQGSPNLLFLYLGKNPHFNTECFELLISALDESNIDTLCVEYCNIEDISALDRYALPNIEYLQLSGTNIGREGCITLANLLQKEASKLVRLDLEQTDIDDEGAEILANSLKNNNTLKILLLKGCLNINEKGCGALLKLVNDVSSIESTYKSNHTLTDFNLSVCDNIYTHILSALQTNRYNGSHAAGRAKVMRSQLNSQTRKKFCELQGIDYCSVGNLFENIEPVLLPQILSLIEERYKQNSLYSALLPIAPDLLSFIDRKALIHYSIAENKEDISYLTSKADELRREAAHFRRQADALSRRAEALSLEAFDLTAKNKDMNKRLPTVS